jgi:hypothetical protein
MTDRHAANERTRPIPAEWYEIGTLDDFDVYYRTRLPIIRERAAELRESRLRHMAILFRALGWRPPFD